MASNEYSNMAELIKDYYDAPVGTYLNQSILINSVTLSCDIYRVEPETVLTPSVFTGCTAVDANTQIVIGRDMSVASGTILIPPYRCKGLIIGDVGTFTNEGTISMTARGASGEGKNIQLTTDYMISAVGGSGGTSVSNESTSSSSYSKTNGTVGSSPSSGILSCGGGGAGGAVSSYSYATSGAGGSGTSFSGGTGGGGAGVGRSYISDRERAIASDGSSIGGAGGASATLQYDKLSFCCGGAGNPRGTSYLGTDEQGTLDSNGEGTGGLIIVISHNIVSSGAINAQGVQGTGGTATTGAGGGASGGGCIVLISRTRTITGTNSVEGGSASSISGTNVANGGAGGAGVYASYIVDDLILVNLPVEIAITDKDHRDNIEPSEAVRILASMDDDELQYDIMGTRHRAVDDTGALDLSRITPPGQRTPDEFEVHITDPQEGQVMKYNATNEQWENGDDYHVYSTDERVVGKWIDGKPLYEKTIDWGTLPTTTQEVHKSHGSSNVDKVINYYGFSIASNGTCTMINGTYINNPMILTDSTITTVYVDRTAVTVRAKGDRSSYNLYVTFQYTKTTDTV